MIYYSKELPDHIVGDLEYLFDIPQNAKKVKLTFDPEYSLLAGLCLSNEYEGYVSHRGAVFFKDVKVAKYTRFDVHLVLREYVNRTTIWPGKYNIGLEYEVDSP